MSKIKKAKRRTCAAHIGDWQGDAMTWRVVVEGDLIVARELSNPAREVSQSIADWLAEKAGFHGMTVDALKQKTDPCILGKGDEVHD